MDSLADRYGSITSLAKFWPGILGLAEDIHINPLGMLDTGKFWAIYTDFVLQ